jgi:hypothetical protein
MNRTPEDIAAAIRTAFPNPDVRPTDAEVEAVMRPLAPESYQYRRAIRHALGVHGGVLFPVDHWMEANLVVSGSGQEHDRAIRFLLMDTCTCVLDILETAIAHAPGPVDPRILALREHPHLVARRIQDAVGSQPPAST